MAQLRLRTQLLIATLVVICTLTGSILFIVRHTVRAEIARQVQESTKSSLRAFESVERQHQLELSRTAAMLAELPTLKALMTTQHALTIQDASELFWKLSGSDLFVLAKPDGKVMGFHDARPGWDAAIAERDLKRSLEQGEDLAWWYADGQLYWVFLRPITAGTEREQRQLGILAVGYQVDSKVAEQLAPVAGSQIALATNDKVIASTLPPLEVAELQPMLGQQNLRPEPATREMILGDDPYQVAAALIHSGPPTPVNCYVLLSLQQANGFIQRLNRMIFFLGISAVVLAALLLSFVSRTITHPLESLVAGVRALAAGDYTYSITPRGSSEVAELGEAFSKMRGDLLESQRRWLANERIAALGSAATSISHDLRHYLAAVVANAEFLYEAEKLKLNRHEIYEEIKTASEQMVELLDSLREFAREDSAISPVSASLEQTIRHAVEAVRAMPELRSRTISIRTSGEMDGVFDPRKLERAFFNLVLNACEAAGQTKGKVEIEVASTADSFEVRIADNGSGIPSSIRNSLFDPFVSSGKPNGTGLGLAIVNKTVHDHGGSVSVERTSEAGTVFLVTLPRAARSITAIARSATF
jgi:signal transduction histidine kinase